MNTTRLYAIMILMQSSIAYAEDIVIVDPTKIDNPNNRVIIANIRNQRFNGIVVAITKTDIIVEGTIGFGLTRECAVFGNHRFHLSKTLQEGKSGNTERSAYSYRIQDIRKGDKIEVVYDRVDLVHTCTQIMLNRRPGGRVPAPPVPEKPGALFPHAEAMNAYQDFEEKGIPLPYKYDSAAQWRDNQALFEQMAWESTLKDIKRSMQEDPSTPAKGNRVPPAKPKPVKKTRPG